MKRLVLAASILALTSGMALAADLSPQPVEPLAPALPYSWAGFYLGAQAGYAWNQARYRITPTGQAFNSGDSEPRPNGVFGGLFGGYNYQFDNGIVLGGEADINYGGMDAKAPNYQMGQLTVNYGHKSRIDWFGSARLRLGYAFGRFMPYVTGGVAAADLKTTRPYANAAAPTVRWDDTMVGWTLGAGLEYAVTDHLTVRAEYRYTDYGHGSRAHNVPLGLGAQRYHLTANQGLIGIAYRF